LSLHREAGRNRFARWSRWFSRDPRRSMTAGFKAQTILNPSDASITEEDTMLLETKTAIIYGGGGAIGSGSGHEPTPARGARVFLAGRTLPAPRQGGPDDPQHRWHGGGRAGRRA